MPPTKTLQSQCANSKLQKAGVSNDNSIATTGHKQEASNTILIQT